MQLVDEGQLRPDLRIVVVMADHLCLVHILNKLDLLIIFKFSRKIESIKYKKLYKVFRKY